MHWPRYLWKAFNARPFGMPVPPLWFAVIASGLVGYFIAPPLALIGLGATAMFTGILASSKRFRSTVDAPLFQAPVESEQAALLRTWACDLGQGFYYSRPLEAASLEALLATDGLPSGRANVA